MKKGQTNSSLTLPVAVDPVKDTLAILSSPNNVSLTDCTELRLQVTTLNTPGGTPAS